MGTTRRRVLQFIGAAAAAAMPEIAWAQVPQNPFAGPPGPGGGNQRPAPLLPAWPKASQVFERIKAAQPASAWNPTGDDRIVFGDPDIPITGLATSFYATLNVLKRAKAAGLNYVIPHENTFYVGNDRWDASTVPATDRVMQAKLAFLRDNKMVVQRMHSHTHSLNGDAIMTGLIRQLGWTSFRQDSVPSSGFVRIPTTSAGELGSLIKGRLHLRTLRMFGDPSQRVSTVSLSMGQPGIFNKIGTVNWPNADATILGEVREPEVVGFAQDLAARRRHAVYMVGHLGTEEHGMEIAAEWLRGVFPELAVHYVPAGDPFVGG